MRFSLTSFIRLATLLFLTSTAAAVGVSRLAPRPRGWRTAVPAAYIGVNNYFFTHSSRTMRWVDLKDGRTRTLPHHEGEGLDTASCSPWRDESGRAQIVGRWMKRTEAGGVEVGIARASFPDGEILDRVATEVVPFGAPCWSPNTRAEVIYAATDGRLYRYAFESPDADPARRSVLDRDERPVPLVWRCPVPGRGLINVTDPHRSTDPKLADLLFVSLRLVEDDRPNPKYSPAQLWWLRLGEDGRAVEGAGRLGTLESKGRRVDERCPAVGRLADGRFALSYLRQVDDRPWELLVAPLRIDESERPVLDAERKRVLVERCVPSPPVFAADGRSIGVIRSDASLKTVEIPGVEIDRPKRRSLAGLNRADGG